MILKIKLHAFNINKNVDIENIKENIDNINNNEFFFRFKKKIISFKITIKKKCI